MRYAAFEAGGPLGRCRRAGVVSGDDYLVDINAAYQNVVTDRVEPDRARILADAIVPADIVSLLGNGRLGEEAVLESLNELGAKANDPSITTVDGQRVVYGLNEVSLISPIPRPPSLRDCSAFEEHIRNTSGKRGIPQQWYEQPVYYKGNPASVAGPGVDVRRPRGVRQLDYELEFAAVIGYTGRDIPEERALEYVAGYTIFNDVSARDLQLPEMRCSLGPAKGKDFDTGNVLGPYLITPDEFDPTQDRAMYARVAGEPWSSGLTSSIYFSVARIISHASNAETLRPGDVIGTGTVGGGCGLEQGRYPQMGDLVELEIQGLGVLVNRFVDPEMP